ncbi:MAG: DUF2141 domain-containing protein [Bacteroidales bacterium]|nr:DUF2141 domain-containing protein [Bacteroidales bacterium]
MRKLILIIGLMSFSTFLFTQEVELTIQINEVRTSQGNIILGIYDNAKSFPKDGKAILVLSVKAEKPTKVVKVDLPKGTYAIALSHDINNNGTCDTNFIGYPTEPFAFSNNVRPRLSAPSFSSASFELNKNTTIQIKLIH